MVSIEIKKKIEEHLILSNKLHIAAKEVLDNGDLFIRNVATKYEIECHILCRKIDIMKGKEQFYDRKRRLDAARKEIMEGKTTYTVVTNNHGICRKVIFGEVKRARIQKNYEYDRQIGYNSNMFTYLQEESLLKILKDWANGETSQDHCSCTFCALEKLLTLAYEFAQENNIECTLWDTSRQASIDWLIDFEMRHTDEIINSFYSFENVCKQIIG